MAPCYYRERNICCIIWNASKTFVLLSSKYNIQSDFLPAETLQPLILPKITSFLCFLHSFTQYVVLSVVMIGFLQEHNLKYFQFLHFLSFLFSWIAKNLYQIQNIVSSKSIQGVKTVFISSIIISYYSGFFLQKPVFVLIETIS